MKVLLCVVGLLAIVIAGCGGATQTPQIVYITPAPTLEVARTAETVTPGQTSGPALSSASFPPAELDKTWQTIDVLKAKDGVASVEGINAPAGLYVLDWLVSGGCDGLLDNGSESWSWGEQDSVDSINSGMDLADLITEHGRYSAFTIPCAPWQLSFNPIGSYFGPNSVQVARLLIRLDHLDYTLWTDMNEETMSHDAEALEKRVLDAAKRDPNLGAAIQHALAPDWYRRNHRLAAQPNGAHIRQLAILAELAQDLLPGDEFDMLYGPMSRYIDPLKLGSPVTP